MRCEMIAPSRWRTPSRSRCRPATFVVEREEKWMRRCVSIVVVIMVGCGGAGSGTPSRAEVCADVCARYVGCGIQRPACESECTADRLFRDDFYPLLVECIDASCSNIGEA